MSDKFYYKDDIGYVISDQKGLEKNNENLTVVTVDDYNNAIKLDRLKVEKLKTQTKEKMYQKSENKKQAVASLAKKLGVTESDLIEAFG